MKLKTVTIDGKVYAEVDGDKPIYEGDDGKPISFDAPHTVATITRLNGEAQGHRTRAEAAETSLKKFEGITDADAARKALDTVKNLDDKKLIDAGQVDTIKAEAIKAVEEKYKPIVEERDRLQTDLYGEKIGGAFSRSKFIADKLAIPADIAQARFEKHFKVEEGQTRAYDTAGNLIYSKAKPGSPAEFDEAFEMLVEGYAHKDSILKGSGNSGSGAQNNGGGPGGGDFSKLSPVERINAARAAQGAQ